MTNDSSQRYRQQRRREAIQMQAEALSLCGLPAESVRNLIERTRLRDRQNSPDGLAINVWDFPTDASAELGGPQDSKAAALFLDAGRRFTDAYEFLKNHSDFDHAMDCLHLAIYCAGRSAGPVAREIEQRAAHAIAYACLTLADVEPNDPGARTANEDAARYFELEGFLMLRQGNREGSASAYGNAAYRYRMASRLKEAAQAVIRQQEALPSLAKTGRVAEAKLERAEALFVDARGVSAASTEAVDALIEAGRNFAEEDSEKLRGADVLLGAGVKGLELLRSNRAQAMPEFQRTLLGALGQAQKLYEGAGDFEKADQCRRLTGQTRREGFLGSSKLGHASPSFLFSSLLDLIWGYGTRPWRLVPTAAFIIGVFWIIYTTAGDLQWNGGPSAGGGRMPYLLTSLILSIKALLPTQLMEWIARITVLPEIKMGAVSKVFAAVESALGLLLATMAGFSVTRWIKRQLPPDQ